MSSLLVDDIEDKGGREREWQSSQHKDDRGTVCGDDDTSAVDDDDVPAGGFAGDDVEAREPVTHAHEEAEAVGR